MTVFMNRNISPKRPLTDEQLIEVVTQTAFHEYPEKESTRFKELYANYNQLDPNQIELANGADEWLQKLMIQFGQEGVLTISPDFFMYEEYARQINRPFWKVESDENFDFDLEKVLEEIQKLRPSLLLVSNPQNPTGKQFSSEFLQAIADEMESIGGYFVIDEAYVEFGDDYHRPSNDNVIIIRTLSKIYAMAGLRIGIAIAKGETFAKLIDINHPYPVSNLALNVANAMFSNKEQLDAWVAYQKECQLKLIQALTLVDDVIKVKPTQSNFIMTYGKYARDLGEYLSENGFVGRTYDADHLKDVVRYSILDIDKYDEFEDLLKTWRKQID